MSPLPPEMADARTPPPDDDAGDWAKPPDRWAEADRAWEAKWSDEPAADEEPPEPVGPLPPAPTPLQGYNTGMREAGPYLGLGLQIAFSMALFVGLGYAADRWLGSSPWGILVGATLGMVGVFALVVRLAKEADARRREEKRGVGR